MSAGYEDARGTIDAAISHAETLGIAVSVAVVDEAGHLVALGRMDGAPFISAEVAWGKAWTSAAFQAPSGKLAENLAPATAFTTAVSVATHGRFTPRQGGLPLPGGGAVGVSGGSPAQDEEVARAGAGG
jgi:uncharacterized protein GlcG (DUF336 family)